jgi:GTP diphosphokinase / guanosine-3',5'-bis(diphosphate) 3'-diphosphatase
MTLLLTQDEPSHGGWNASSRGMPPDPIPSGSEAMPRDPSATAHTSTIHGLPRPLARALEAYSDRLDVDLISDAYDLAVEAHGGQTRASGEEYVTHTIEVATLLAQLRLDSNSIIAGLIHDTVEDTDISLKDLESRFGSGVATIVDGVTKLGKVKFSSAT